MQSAGTANKPKATKQELPEHPSGDQRFKILDATRKRHQYCPDAFEHVRE